MSPAMSGANGGLAAPERNRFYYGKLMDVVHFSKEQDYFNRKRWLLNRLVVGSGVVAGLSVAASGPGILTIQPGMAIDGLGREIIVPSAITVDPQQLTNDKGDPAGQAASGAATTISLVYFERETDPSPVLAADCDSPHGCTCGTIREQYRLLVRQGIPAPAPPASMPVDGAQAYAGSLSLNVPQDASVPLARVMNGAVLDPGPMQPLVYSNALLFEMILSLADQVRTLTSSPTQPDSK